MSGLLDSWDDAKRAPEPVAVARRSAGEATLDVLLAREEFRSAGEKISEGASLGDASRRDLGKFASGLGAGVFTAGTFVFPWGRGGGLALRGAGAVAGRGARVGALRSAAGLGDEALEGVAGGAGRQFDDPARAAYDELSALVSDGPSYPAFVQGVQDAAAEVASNGFSWSPITGKFYRLGVDAESMVGVSPGHSMQVPVEDFSAQDIVKFFGQRDASGRTVSRVLADDPSTVIGGWVDEGKVYLDVSRAYRSVDEAMQVGGLLGERAVIDLSRATFREASQTIPDAYRPKGRLFNVDAMSIPGAAQRGISGLSVSSSPLPPGQVSGESRGRLLRGQPMQGERLMGAIMTPIEAPRQFGATTAESAKKIFDAMAERGPLRLVTGDDLNTEGMISLLENMKTQIEKGAIKFNIEDFIPFTQRQAFADDLGLVTPSLIQGKTGMTFRPMMDAIVRGDFAPVLDDLAEQINNVFTLLDEDVFNVAFYPFMHNSTMVGAKASGNDPVLLAALSAVLSAGQAPIPEARAVGGVLQAAKGLQVVRGELVIPSAMMGEASTALKAYTQLINNPDWLSSPVLGLATKTYVYAMLKLNPRMARALVIDRVDTSARLAAKEMDVKKVKDAWQWKPETAKDMQGIELALGGFAERVVASSLNIPPSAVQENVWAIWRVLRDLQAGNGPSRSSSTRSASGETMQGLLSKGRVPKSHRELFESNLAALRDEVSGGGPAARYWEVAEPPALGRETLVPRTDMPIDGYLPPAIRTPENVAALEGAIGNAEVIGEGLRSRLPWAPIALQLSLLGIFGSAVIRESEVNVYA